MSSKAAGGARPDPGYTSGLEPSAESTRLGALDRFHGRREVICLALAAAEVCWVTPFFLALNWARNPHSPVLLWLGLLILMVGYFYFYRALAAGYRLVSERAEAINDDRLSEMYVQNIPFNREVLRVWHKVRERPPA